VLSHLSGASRFKKSNPDSSQARQFTLAGFPLPGEFPGSDILLQQICRSEGFDNFPGDDLVCPIVVPPAYWEREVANIGVWLFKYGIDNFQRSIFYRHLYCPALK
jgi:hypothetical protein